jgi:addiction module HigA family antidote
LARGETSVTADTALRLARWLGTTQEFWMNLQSAHDLAITGDRAAAALAAISPRAA